MVIMGFNTEIEHEGVVYHVQTERRRDSRIETMVYLQGAIIHSLKTSCQESRDSSGYSDEKLRLLLRDQHQQVIARIRAGEIGPPGTARPGTKPGGVS